MKTKEETLFEKMQPGESGLKPLTDAQILEAMQEYAEAAVAEYIIQRTGCKSKYEAERAARIFLEVELF